MKTGAIRLVQTEEERAAKERETQLAELAAQRIQLARSCRAWTELEDDLVPRPFGRLVSASTLEAYVVYRGATFSGSRLQFDSDRPLHFVVRDGDVLVLESVGQWTDLMARR
jgi:hypothetical protein